MNNNYFGSVIYGALAIWLFAVGVGPWAYVAGMAWGACYIGSIGEDINDTDFSNWFKAASALISIFTIMLAVYFAFF